MTAAARFTPRARAEIREAGAWIANDSRSAALAFRQGVASVARLIAEHPKIGVARLDIAPAPYRFFVVKGFPYIVVYDSAQHPPTIVRVVHGARDLPDTLRGL